ncbi:hypothetical protein ACIGAN_26155 [Streptomyces sp. NPDC085931]|uniref:hypothetical protein n=1 Tax=Streptomyces sp. NPDC085931 TaxID=3365740 RepID=UPI0037D2CE3F
MAAYADPRFRPTLWPGTPVPLPEMTPMHGVRAEGDWIVWTVQDLDRAVERTSLPDDFYLRELMEVDPADLATVAGWMNQYGHLGGSIEAGSWDYEEHSRLQELQEREHPRYGPFSLHGELVRLHISEAQGAIATWLACRRPGGLDELVESEVTEQHLADIAAENDHDDSGYPTTLDELRSTTLGLRLALLRSALRYNLAPFSVGLGSLTDRQPSILSAAFLQLYNHLAEDATIRTCANETCGRDFVRQRGRAEYGQNRTSGIKYCTRECARAQAQREHRRRKAATARPTVAAEERLG